MIITKDEFINLIQELNVSHLDIEQEFRKPAEIHETSDLRVGAIHDIQPFVKQKYIQPLEQTMTIKFVLP